MKQKLLYFVLYFFMTIRINNNPTYGIENGFLMFEFSKHKTPIISESGVRLFQFNFR